jgi:large subunit ribosomal protein L7/L12
MIDEEKKEQEETKENEEANKQPDKANGKPEPETKEEPSKEAKEAPEAPKEAPKQVQDTPSEKKEEVKTPEPKKEVKVSGKLADIIKNIEGLSVLELADLVKALEEKFGVSAAAPVAVAGAPAGGAEGEQEEGQTTFNVVLADAGANKISVIKAVRELVPTLGLKEAKDLVDSAPKQVLEGAGKDAANEAKQKLETAGGKVELK